MEKPHRIKGRSPMMFVRRCPYCLSKVVLRPASFVYPGRKDLNGKNFWVCLKYPACDSYVGCHDGTDVPKGTLANRELRELRMEAHYVFDRLWKDRVMSRGGAYRWLAHRLGIGMGDCHIGMFDKDRCLLAISLCSSFRQGD